jgi:hypothetical protein
MGQVMWELDVIDVEQTKDQTLGGVEIHTYYSETSP